MRWLLVIRMRLRSLFRLDRVERDLREEIEYHLDREIERNVASGMSAEEARFAALRAMQGAEQQKEACRDARGTMFWDTLAQDLRYACRGLRKKPGFTFVAVASLALGIGFNTAVFGFLNTLLLAKLPVRDPDHLYQLIVTHRTTTHNRFSYPDFEKLSSNFDFIESIAVWGTSDFEVETSNGKAQARGAYVSDSYFHVLGLQPAAGRLFADGDDTASAATIAVLGYGFWQRTYAGEASAPSARRSRSRVIASPSWGSCRKASTAPR